MTTSPDINARFFGEPRTNHRGHLTTELDARGRVILQGPYLRLRMTRADAYALADMLVDTAEQPRKRATGEKLEAPPS